MGLQKLTNLELYCLVVILALSPLCFAVLFYSIIDYISSRHSRRRIYSVTNEETHQNKEFDFKSQACSI